MPTPHETPRARSAGWSLALVAVPLAFGCSPVRYTEAFHPEDPVTAIRIDVDEGTVELVPGARLRVERAIRAPEQSLDLRHDVVDGVIVLTARCTSIIPCAVDTRVDVPEGLPVTVNLSDGEVWATGVSDLRLALGEGSADVDIQGRLTAQVGTGDVRGRLGADAQARVTVGRGDIDLQVPSGAWRIDATADRLAISGVQPDDSAAGSLALIAPSGLVRVRGELPLAAR